MSFEGLPQLEVSDPPPKSARRRRLSTPITPVLSRKAVISRNLRKIEEKQMDTLIPRTPSVCIECESLREELNILKKRQLKQSLQLKEKEEDNQDLRLDLHNLQEQFGELENKLINLCDYIKRQQDLNNTHNLTSDKHFFFRIEELTNMINDKDEHISSLQQDLDHQESKIALLTNQLNSFRQMHATIGFQDFSKNDVYT
ncbi:hypothetical protein PCE1_002348 [Barthelona sp. PCE]